MLSFELKASAFGPPDELEIHGDSEGLDSLIAQLQLLRSGKTDHVHLFSPSWGGSHLADAPVAKSNTTLHHVKIYLLAGGESHG